MGSREGLTQRLSRERLKDTSLDYELAVEPGQEEGERTPAYAERRDLVPGSEIMLRAAGARSPEEKTAAREAEGVMRR